MRSISPNKGLPIRELNKFMENNINKKILISSVAIILTLPYMNQLVNFENKKNVDLNFKGNFIYEYLDKKDYQERVIEGNNYSDPVGLYATSATFTGNVDYSQYLN